MGYKFQSLYPVTIIPEIDLVELVNVVRKINDIYSYRWSNPLIWVTDDSFALHMFNVLLALKHQVP